MDTSKEYIRKRLGFNTYEQCLEFPQFIELETVRACNARCTFCAIDNWADKKVKDLLLPEDLIEKFYNDIQPHVQQIDTVCLCRDGEPLLDRKLADRIAKLKEMGIANVTFSTNAQLLTAKRSQEFIDAGLTEIFFSIDGYSKEVFESIRKNLHFEKVISNVKKFVELRDAAKSPLRIRIRLVITDENKHEVDDWYNFWKPILRSSDLIQARPLHNWGNQLNKENESNIEKYNEIPCIAPFNMFVVHQDGRVVMCGHDYKSKHVIGDYNTQSISQIWNGEEVNKIRHYHLNKQRCKVEMCNGCDIWDRVNETE